VLQLQCLARDWAGAAATLAQQIKSGLLPADEGHRKEAAMLAAQALALEDSDRSRALDLAVRAIKLDPALVPAALVAARCHIAGGSPRKAARLLHAAWAKSPHPDLAEVMAHLKPGDGPEGRFERVRDLVREQPGGVEGAVALARAAALAQRWDIARKALEDHLEDRPEARICVLMADMEEAQGDKGRAREWLARAVSAPRDPIWVSDGVASQRWTPVSPVSGEIVPCLWKAPFDMPEGDLRLPRSEPQPAASLQSPAARPMELPRAPEPLRPPDDPGVADTALEPESAARRSLATES
jgi:HemY protein